MSENLPQQIRHGLSCDPEGKAHSVIEKMLCIAGHPGQLLLRPMYQHFERRYHGKFRFARTVFVADMLLLGLIAGLAVAALILFFYKPSSFADKIFFEAEVAPSEVTTGAPATLILRYTNGTGEELRDVKLTLDFPAHFLLESVSVEDVVLEGDEISLGTLDPGDRGSLKIRGVMFGDVGGEQIFRSLMTFTHGENNQIGQKISIHPVVPVTSALVLSLALPEKLIAYQTFQGTITYENTSPVDFPAIRVEPEWPDGFLLVSSSPTLTQGAWSLPMVKSGEQGSVTFSGRLTTSPESVTFIFHPFFSFGADRYSQETLVHEAPIVPPQVTVSHSVETDSVRPGGMLIANVSYQNTGDTPIYDLVLSLETSSPFVTRVPSVSIGTVPAGESGETQIEVPLRSSIAQSETSVYGNFDVVTRAKASYRLGESTASQEVVSLGSEIVSPLTTLVTLYSFGRYATEQGDQLGRGSLPPVVGEETKYWIFWNVSGTTNELLNVKIVGHLSDGVTFTGRQTVSVGEAVDIDEATGTVSWKTASLPTTFAPNAKIVGVAFEVAITPTEAQVGTTPTLLSDVRLTATDARTGAFITASGAAVTTDLPSDALAAGLGIVE